VETVKEGFRLPDGIFLEKPGRKVGDPNGNFVINHDANGELIPSMGWRFVDEKGIRVRIFNQEGS